jgi:hypothetical protein
MGMQSDKSASDSALGEELSFAAEDLHDADAPRMGEHPRRAALVSTIEGEIVPRLLMLCRAATPARAESGPARQALEPADVDELARLLLAHGPAMACAWVETIRQRGAPYDRICLDLLAPTARRLVEGWENQDFSYAALTGSLDALHAVVLEVSGAARSARPVSRGG